MDAWHGHGKVALLDGSDDEIAAALGTECVHGDLPCRCGSGGVRGSAPRAATHGGGTGISVVPVDGSDVPAVAESDAASTLRHRRCRRCGSDRRAAPPPLLALASPPLSSSVGCSSASSSLAVRSRASAAHGSDARGSGQSVVVSSLTGYGARKSASDGSPQEVMGVRDGAVHGENWHRVRDTYG